MKGKLSLYIANLGELSWGKTLVLALVAAGGYYAAFYSDGTALQAKGQNLEQQVAQAQESLATMKKTMQSADKFKAEVESLALRLKQVAEVMPKDLGAAELTGIITDQAGGTGMRVVKVEPLAKIDRGEFYETTRVKFVLTGSYAQALTFFSAMTKIPKLLTYEDVDLSLLPGDNPEKAEISLSGKLVGYRYFGVEPTAKTDSTSVSAGKAEGGVNGNP